MRTLTDTVAPCLALHQVTVFVRLHLVTLVQRHHAVLRILLAVKTDLFFIVFRTTRAFKQECRSCIVGVHTARRRRRGLRRWGMTAWSPWWSGWWRASTTM